MAEDINKWMLTGRVGQDPELRFTKSGFPILNLRIASNYRAKRDGEWVEETEWTTVVILGKRAEGLARIVETGKQLAIEGRAQTRSWEGNDGTRKYMTELLADNVVLMGGGKPRERAQSRDVPEDEDIPF